MSFNVSRIPSRVDMNAARMTDLFLVGFVVPISSSGAARLGK
jgi:hypothetical protein